jgi:hypothetical protein
MGGVRENEAAGQHGVTDGCGVLASAMSRMKMKMKMKMKTALCIHAK